MFFRILKYRRAYNPPEDIEAIVEDAVVSNAEVSGDWKDYSIADLKTKFNVLELLYFLLSLKKGFLDY